MPHRPVKDDRVGILPGQRRQFGLATESLALKFLRRRNMKLLARNYHCRAGEIDLIMRNGTMIVFVEVRFRMSLRYGSPVESVTPSKQARIIRCARHFLLHNPQPASYDFRFDIIGITQPGQSGGYRIEWIKNAFDPGL